MGDEPGRRSGERVGLTKVAVIQQTLAKSVVYVLKHTAVTAGVHLRLWN